MFGLEDEILARDNCPYYSAGRCYDRSAWYWWGRWVLAGAVVLFVIFLLVLCGCLSARRRRKRGLHPMYGTGWMAPSGRFGPPHQQQQWAGAYGQGGYGAPPKYGAQEQQNYQYGPQQDGGVQPQYTGTTFQTGDGYYGGHHNEGVQIPQSTYQGVYSPPAGPPPGK